ncbi:Hypothetical predicted protein [Olea europaea subsp. europaea]|uniref:Uncharacterized protein n=1 Tax=Olea europaea subsp. europaea TaxID=158383 RepID=A0A8S0QDX4_OLEEU|nr:Hypothetical predicted protein [Olea europaea subsp. europaea]
MAAETKWQHFTAAEPLQSPANIKTEEQGTAPTVESRFSRRMVSGLSFHIEERLKMFGSEGFEQEFWFCQWNSTSNGFPFFIPERLKMFGSEGFIGILVLSMEFNFFNY